MKAVNPAFSFEENLYQTDLGWGETYAEHKKNCEFGCCLCAAERRRESELNDIKATEIAGVEGEAVLEFRKKFRETTKISAWFFNHEDMRDSNGALIKEVYIILQSQGFSDEQIRRYFRINNHEWHRFKKDKFPTWSADKDAKEDIVTAELPAAKKWYDEKYVILHKNKG